MGRGTIGDMGTGQAAALRLPRVEDSNHTAEVVEDKGARISVVRERA